MDPNVMMTGMIMMDSMRMQQQLDAMNQYEYWYRHQRNPMSSSHISIRPTVLEPPTNPFPKRILYRPIEDCVEFPIASYNVLQQRYDGVLSIVKGFLVCVESEGFEWGYYKERIIKGLKTLKEPLVCYLKTKSTLIPILEESGFRKRELMIDGVHWMRLEYRKEQNV